MDLRDTPATYPVLRSTAAFDSGRVIAVRTDVVNLPGDEQVTRDVVVHPGAVGIIPLDEQDRVLLVHQYRHPASYRLWEPPAGLLDVDGEEPLAAAARELVEEAGLRAARWDVLVDAFTSPGMSGEAIRIYLARDLEQVERPPGAGEERDLPTAWVALDDAVSAVLAGEVHNPMAIMGVLATVTARRDAFRGIRPAGAPWPAGPKVRGGRGAPGQ